MADTDFAPVPLLSSPPKERPPSVPRAGNAFQQQTAIHEEAPLQDRSPVGVVMINAAVMSVKPKNRGERVGGCEHERW